VTRVYDCFIFSRELDLLEIRLNELSPVVDVFVLAESPTTHQGEPKPLYFQENIRRFAAFQDRIRHIVVDQMPQGGRKADHFRREYHQRDALIAGLNDARPDDVVLLSDVDEIIRATAVRAVTNGRDPRPTVHCLEQRMYKYFLDSQHRDPWSRSGPRAVRRRYLRSMQGLRNVHPPTSDPSRSALRWFSACVNMGRPVRRVVHRDAGWHFSSMGGTEAVAQKLASFSHIVRDRHENPDWNLHEAAAARIEAARSDRKLKIVGLDETFPAFLVENQARYRHMLAGDDLRTRDVAPPSPP
jgi:beta-1,4-mannosyl-glycoprotein beta-1,4-N-acetylglucosaminyltransferase